MKKIIKIFLPLILSLSFMLPAYGETGAEIFEKAAKEALLKNYEAQIATGVAQTLEIHARYEDTDRGSLYEGALDAILKEHPELLDTALSGMLSSIDENSVYYTEDEKNKLFDNLTDEIYGIGVTVLTRDTSLIVSQPIPGSPAEKAGIREGDIIIEADGKSLIGMDMDLAVDHIRGPAGTSVNIKVWRSATDTYHTFDIVREKITQNPVDYEIIEDGDRQIAKITLYSFTENAHTYFEEAMNEIDKMGIKNIILDLRGNGGGYLNSAIQIADRFLGEDAVILSEDHKIPLFNSVYKATGKDTDYKIVVLINEMSASASEVLTAALRENNKAKVIGKNSFGKGTVQTIVDIANGGVAKFTVAYYLTPLGNNIDKVGIRPDAIVENSLIDVDPKSFGEFNLNKKFSLGDKAPEVETAKKALSYMGIFIGEINDVFDENLKIAVHTYQDIMEDLYPYGVLDKTTQMSIFNTLSQMKEEVDDQLKAALDAF